MGTAAGVTIVLTILAIVVAVLWVLMPFAIFGTKPILRELLAEQRKTNRLLEDAAQRSKMPTDVVLVSTRKATDVVAGPQPMSAL